MIVALPRLVGLLLISFTIVTGVAGAELTPAKNRVPADAFTLRDLDGRLASLRDFEGKVVLLNFWATWCAPCLKEMPAMERLYQAYRPLGLVVVGVSVDQSSPTGVREFAQRLKVTYPILHDRDMIVSRLYNNPGVPVSFLIDRRGRITHRVLGEYDWFATEARDAIGVVLQDK